MTIYDSIALKNDMTIEFIHDEDCENPRDYDGNPVVLYCIKNRYGIGSTGNDIAGSDEELDEKMAEIQEDGDYAVLPLYLLDHSGIAISTSSFNDPWDSGCIGFAAAKISEFSAATKEYAESVIRDEVNVYNDYLQGNCWQYIIRDKDGEIVDSCAGFIGDDIDKNGIMDYIRDYIDD